MRVLVWHTAGFALGIALGDVLRLPVPATLFLALAALAFTLLVFFRTGNLRLLVILSLFIGIFWGQIHHLEYQDLTFKPGERIQAVGTAVGEPSPTATGKAFLFQVSRSNDIQDTKLKVRVICDSREEVHYGDVLKISGKILDTPVPSNPHQFNYDAYLKRHGIAGTVSTMYGGTITPLGENRGNKLLQAVYGLKGKMDRVLSQLPSNQQSFIGGMLFGDKGNLSFEERNILSQTGLMDAFAVSGVHVGYVIFFTLSLAQVLKLGKWGRFILTFFTVLFYAALSEFTPSVLRSGAMALLGLLAYSLGEKKDFYTALALAALPMLILNPQMIYDAGFQLSFLAAWGVVYLMPVVRRWFPFKGFWVELLAAAVSAQLALIPLLAYYFNVLTIAGLAVGILASGLVGVVVLLGLFSLVLSIFSTSLALLPAYGAGIVVEGIWQMAKVISGLPGAYATVRTPSLLLILFFYGVLFSLPYLIKIKKGRLLTGLTAFILVILLSFPVLGTGRLHVTFVDVGQGDCIFIQGPSGRTCLVDGGGKPHTTGSNVGERVVVPFLKSEGLDRLDLMILTHPHDDHMNGLLPVLKELDVKRLIVARAFLTVPEIQPLLDLAAREKVPVIPVARGQEVILDQGLKLRILNPGPAMTVTGGDDMNNNSLVLKMSYGQVSFLFTADTEIECLSSLVESGIDLKADVLKIPHHGSKNSFLPSFYDQVSPRMVVICVGKNTFGHPSGEVVAFWQKQKIPVFRTDLQGAVSLSSDGKDIFVETFKDSSSIKAP